MSCAYIGAFETNRREINDRIIGLICVNCGASEKWLPNGTGKLFKDKHNPRLDRVMRNFEKLDDYLQEYVIKQLDILVEFQEKNKSNR